MRMLKGLLWLWGLAVALMFGATFVACSDDESVERVVGSFTEDGKQFSPKAFYGVVEYAGSMVPGDARLVMLDYDLNALDSVEIAGFSKSQNYYKYDTYEFSTGELEFPSPHVKLVIEFPIEGSRKKMEISQYVNMGDVEYWKKSTQNLVGALIFERVTKLVQDSGLDYNNAKILAQMEFAKTLGIENWNYEETPLQTHKNLLWPYFYCRHFVSDSVFYSDFLELRRILGRGDSLDSSVYIRMADDMLRRLETVPHEKTNFVRMNARDTGFFKVVNYKQIWKKAYGFDFEAKVNRGTVYTVDVEDSELCGRRFVAEDVYRSWSSPATVWRPVSALEDTLGLCLNDLDTLVKRDGLYYKCPRESSVWEIVEDQSEVTNRLYEVCDLQKWGKVRLVDGDYLMCVCPRSDSCAWKADYTEGDVPSGVNVAEAKWIADIVAEYGECENSLWYGGLKFQRDSVYLGCRNKTWKKISYEDFYLPDWSREGVGDTARTPDGRYFVMKSDGWAEVLPPEFFKDSCFAANVVYRDSAYYICRDGSWEPLAAEDVIPPVVHVDPCGNREAKLLKKYDDVYYLCLDSKWQVAPEEFLTPPVLAGFFCVDSLDGKEQKVDSNYFLCKYRTWLLQGDSITALRNLQERYGNCSTVEGTSMYWDEKSSILFACAGQRTRSSWMSMQLPKEPFAFPDGISKSDLVGGTYATYSDYEKTIGETDYVFYVIYDDVYMSKITLEGVRYDAYFYHSNMFLHSERANSKMYLDSVADKSESFDRFYADWKARAKLTNDCDSRYADVKEAYIQYMGENSYVDWAAASSFCPAGFHIPDTTEFMSSDFLAYPTTSARIRNDSPIIDYYVIDRTGCNTHNYQYYSILWTSTAKDSDTQYCYEYSYDGSRERVRRIIECPKDLYPMVQVVCVKD